MIARNIKISPASAAVCTRPIPYLPSLLLSRLVIDSGQPESIPTPPQPNSSWFRLRFRTVKCQAESNPTPIPVRLQKSDSESGVDSRPFHFFSFDSDSALGLEELNPTPIPGGKWWSGVDSDSESRQNGVDSGFGVDSTGINYKSALVL